jgi:hypothetical protein
MPDTVVRFKGAVRCADAPIVAKKPKAKGPLLGPSTVVKPALLGAAVLVVVQTAMKLFLGA